ncbi:hypothetical protein [Nocardia nova]|uniref:hypothetical protein n=1 Tax=Nocardia nova TaxID=37330 RepID=UPI0033D79D23
MTTTPPSDVPKLVYLQPQVGGLAVVRCSLPAAWLEPGHHMLTCAACSADLRPGAVDERSRFNIPDPRTPRRMRLYCGSCCNDGLDEIARLGGRQGVVTGTGRVPGRRLSPGERAAQRRIGAVIRSCAILSEDGLALWREHGSEEFEASTQEIADDLGALGVPHTVVPATRPPRSADRDRRDRVGEEVRISSQDLPGLVAWLPSLQKYIDKLENTRDDT